MTSRRLPAASMRNSSARSAPIIATTQNAARASVRTRIGSALRIGESQILQAGAKRRKLDAAQRQKLLAGLPAQALHTQHRRVADAIDREQHRIGTADQTGQQPTALLD